MNWRNIMRVLATVGAVLLVGISSFITMSLLGFFLLSGAFGHSFYDPACCSETDCRPVAAEDVIETEAGWKYLPTGTEFTKDMVKPSQDRNFHVCIGNRAWDLGRPYCIYVLQGA